MHGCWKESLVHTVCVLTKFLGNLHTSPLHFIMINYCVPAERPHCTVLLPVIHIQAVLKSGGFEEALELALISYLAYPYA